MSFSSILPLALILEIAIPLVALRADDSSSTTEMRLRDALREARAQLSDAQYQVASLQAAKDQADKDNADLKAKNDALDAQVAALTKQGADDKAASDKAIVDLNAQVASLTTQLTQLNQELADAKNSAAQATKLAADKEAARAKFEIQSVLLQRRVDDRETQNLELYKTGSEILTRYEKFSLGEALDAKEPFAGQSRLKLEALIEDYKGKLLNQTVGAGAPNEPARAASNPAQHPNVQAGHETSPPAKT